MLGVNLDTSKLYPCVEFPVAPGTPMLSQFIDWDHTKQWPVIVHEDLIAGKYFTHMTFVMSNTTAFIRSFVDCEFADLYRFPFIIINIHFIPSCIISYLLFNG